MSKNLFEQINKKFDFFFFYFWNLQKKTIERKKKESMLSNKVVYNLIFKKSSGYIHNIVKQFSLSYSGFNKTKSIFF